jgi:hypothetical protein
MLLSLGAWCGAGERLGDLLRGRFWSAFGTEPSSLMIERSCFARAAFSPELCLDRLDQSCPVADDGYRVRIPRRRRIDAWYVFDRVWTWRLELRRHHIASPRRFGWARG